MDARQLKYFVQIVESGSLSKASRQLFIVQPALSQQMAKLEEAVGKPLLLRSVRGVKPTENGEALYHHAKFVLRQLDEAVAVARRDLSDVHGHVVLGLAPSTACILGLPLLRHLKARFPGIALTMVVGLPGHLEERARQAQLDVAILFSQTAASDLTYEHLLDEDVFIVLPADSTLVPQEQASLTLAEVEELPLVLSSTHHHLRRRLALELERVGRSPRIAAEIDSLELVMRYVAEGGGATVQPMAATHIFNAPQRWRCVPIQDAPMPRPNYLYALPAQKLSASAAIVCAQLKQFVHELVRQGHWGGVALAQASAATTPTFQEDA